MTYQIEHAGEPIGIAFSFAEALKIAHAALDNQHPSSVLIKDADGLNDLIVSNESLTFMAVHFESPCKEAHK